MLSSSSLFLFYLFLMLTPALRTSSTSSSCDATTGADCSTCLLTHALSQIPASAASRAPPLATSTPIGAVDVVVDFFPPSSSPSSPARRRSSSTAKTASTPTCPAFSARVFGTASSASAKAATPSFALPTASAPPSSRTCAAAATSKAPAPGTSAPSSMAFLTARRPSRRASLI